MNAVGKKGSIEDFKLEGILLQPDTVIPDRYRDAISLKYLC